MKSLMRSWVWLGVLAAAGCATSPNQGDIIALDFDYVGRMYIDGYSDRPNQLLDVQLKDWVDGRWDTVAQVRSASAQTFPINSFGMGSPALYHYPIGPTAETTLIAPWIPDNDRHYGGLGIQLRIVKSGTEEAVWAGTAAAEGCVIGGYGTSRTVQQLGLDCGFTLQTIDIIVQQPIG